MEFLLWREWESSSFNQFSKHCGRHSVLMVSSLVSGMCGPGSSPGSSTVMSSGTRHFTLIVPLSAQVYKINGKWQIYCWGNPAMD